MTVLLGLVIRHKARPAVRSFRLTFLLLAALGCSGQAGPSEPPTGFEHAYASPSCAPWDGFAVSLVLRGAPLAPGDSAIEAGDSPQLRLALYPRTSGTGPSGLRPGTDRWPDQPEVAVGSRCDAGRCTTMPSGRIIVQDVEAGGRFRGTLDLLLQDGSELRGSFDADWRPRRMFCL